MPLSRLRLTAVEELAEKSFSKFESAEYGIKLFVENKNVSKREGGY